MQQSHNLAHNLAHNLVSTDWLLENLDTVKPIDASWHMPDSNTDAQGNFAASHIKGALFFDIESTSDQESPLPHTLPRAEEFANCAGKLGISNTDTLVFYDNSPVRSAARAWWMFRYFGHQNIYVLDGGLAKWQREGKPVTDVIAKYPQTTYSADANLLMAINLAQMVDTIKDSEKQIVDARAQNRFEGQEAEPRPGLRAGHMPGARNLPFNQLFHEDGTYKPAEEIAAAFEDAGIDLKAPVITSCGSGVTACVLTFAMALLGKHDVQMYDGSWTEYGSQPDTPVTVGPVQA